MTNEKKQSVKKRSTTGNGQLTTNLFTSPMIINEIAKVEKIERALLVRTN